MDFIFFEKLSKKDAELYLKQFLLKEEDGLKELLHDFEREQIIIDFSIESIYKVLEWAKFNLKTIPEKEDDKLPNWIRESDSYKKGLFKFDDISKILILRISYYFGECFVRDNIKLSWNIGKINTAVYNMPVVVGFKGGLELAPILICENLVSRLLEGAEPSIIYTALEYWQKMMR
jgi:hypothetical protein